MHDRAAIGGDAVALILDGSVGPSVTATRSLAGGGFRVVAPAGTRAAASRHCRETVELPAPDAAPDAFVEALDRLLERRSIDLLVPASDASLELLASHPAWRAIPWLAGAPASVDVALDKAGTLAAADAVGFPTPRSVLPATLEEGLAAVGDIGLPCCVKPRRSFSRVDGTLRSRRHRFVSSEAEARAALIELQLDDGTPPLVQEIAPGRAIAVAAVIQRGQVLAFSAVEEVTSFPLAGGTSVLRRTVPPDTPAVADALRLLVESGYEGLGEVEYQLCAHGGPRLMELNPRLFAHVGLSVQAGVDLPLLSARSALGLPVEPVQGYAVGAQRRWLGGEALRLRCALSSAPLPPGIRRRDVLRGAWPPWRPGMRYDELDRRDPWPYLPSAVRPRRRRPQPARTAAATSGGVEIRSEPVDSPAALGLTIALDTELHARYSRYGPLVRPLRWLRGGRGARATAAYGACHPPDGAFLVARLDGRVAACGGLRRLDDDVAEVKAMYVRPAARGRGLSRMLLDRLEDEARRLGYRAIRLETGDRQPEAQSLYASAGFVRIPCYGRFAARASSVCFEKRIDDRGAEDSAAGNGHRPPERAFLDRGERI